VRFWRDLVLTFLVVFGVAIAIAWASSRR